MEATSYDIQPTESQALQLEEIARSINARGLTVPAIFFLEMQKPLATVTGSALSVIEPFLQCLFGKTFARSACGILSSREQSEALIALLEELG